MSRTKKIGILTSKQPASNQSRKNFSQPIIKGLTWVKGITTTLDSKQNPTFQLQKAPVIIIAFCIRVYTTDITKLYRTKYNLEMTPFQSLQSYPRI